MIQCNEIQQNINNLLIAFQDCNKIKNEDLRILVELIAAVDTCSGGGPLYNSVLNNVYESEEDTVITYPANNFHSISIVVSLGNIIYNGITLPAGSSINLEFTTLNQQSLSFTAKAGSKILVERIIETI